MFFKCRPNVVESIACYCPRSPLLAFRVSCLRVDKHSDDYRVYKFSNRSIRFPDLSRRHRGDHSVQLSNLTVFARANASGSTALERVPFVRSCLSSRLAPIDVIIVEKCRAIGYESRRIIIIGKNVNNDYRKSFAGGRIATLFSHFLSQITLIIQIEARQTIVSSSVHSDRPISRRAPLAANGLSESPRADSKFLLFPRPHSAATIIVVGTIRGARDIDTADGSFSAPVPPIIAKSAGAN